MVWLEKLWWRLWITVGAIGGLGFGLCGALLLFSQTMTWLKTAYWPPHTIVDALLFMGMPVPYIQNWAGIETIVDDVLQWPQILGHLVFGSIFLLIWVKAYASLEAVEIKEQKANRMKENAGKKASNKYG